MEGKGNAEVFLLSFTFDGIKKIEEPLSLRFYKTTIDDSFDRKMYKIKGIYGENGVGKSATITAVKLYRELMLSSRFLRDNTNNERLFYLVNKKKESASFESEYLIKDEETIDIYRFRITIKKNSYSDLYEITHESCCSRKPNSVYKTVYENKNGELSVNVERKFAKYLTDISRNVLKEKSFLSIVIDDENFNNIYKTEFERFKPLLLCHVKTRVYMDDKEAHDEYIYDKLARKLLDNNAQTDYESFSSTIDYISCNHRISVKEEKYDFYKKGVEEATKFIRIFKPDLKKIDVVGRRNRDKYECELEFVYDDYVINGEFESTGIKKLIELFVSFKRADRGDIVFIDELDANIHDFYLCKLLEYMGEYAKGQLCFTSHNLGPMRVLDKYKKSIDFLSRDGSLVPWIKNGNYQADNQYRKGLIEKSPFNLEAFDFLEVFGN